MIERGYSFVELLIVTTILLILAAAIQPLARVTIQRQKESELRRDLRDLREAIDGYYELAAAGQLPATELKPGNEGYPPDLETLVEGVSHQQRRHRPQGEVPAADPDRPDDRRDEVGTALVSGQARRHALGRTERVRRALGQRRHGARRHQVPGLVDAMLTLQRRRDGASRIHADRVAGRDRAHRGAGQPGARGLSEQYRARARSGAEGRPVPAARRHRPVLRRQEQMAADSGGLWSPTAMCGRCRTTRSPTRSTPGRPWPAEPDPANPSAEPGIFDVKSGSEGTSLDGTPYAEW